MLRPVPMLMSAMSSNMPTLHSGSRSISAMASSAARSVVVRTTRSVIPALPLALAERIDVDGGDDQVIHDGNADQASRVAQHRRDLAIPAAWRRVPARVVVGND